MKLGIALLGQNKHFLNPTISNILNNPFPKVLGLGRSSKTLLYPNNHGLYENLLTVGGHLALKPENSFKTEYMRGSERHIETKKAPSNQ